MPPPKKPLPPPLPPRANGQATRAPRQDFEISSGVEKGPEIVVMYGAGGVGKTELASLIAKQGVMPLFVDIGTGSHFLDVKRVNTIKTWEDVRDFLHSDKIDPFGAVVIDDLTKAEEMATDWVVRNIAHEKGKPITNIEDYGFGKGYGHVYDQFLLLLQDLDAIKRKGKWVICIAHECISEFPNPYGEPYIRYEPRLQSPKSGKQSIRLRVKEWCDHLLFIGYDVHSSEGKASGSGTRCIYPLEQGSCMAKTRTLTDAQIVYEQYSDRLWELILKGSRS